MTWLSTHKKYVGLGLCWFILLLPNIATMIWSTDLTYSISKEVAYLSVVIVGMLIPITFLRQRTYFTVVGVLSLFWGPIEIASLYLNKMTVSSHFLGLIVDTNRIEAYEVLVAVWPLLIVIAGTWIVYWLIVAKMRNEYLLPFNWRKWIWVSLPLLAILGIISLYVVQPRTNEDNKPQQQFYVATKLAAMKFMKIYPYDFYIASHALQQEKAYVRQLNEQISEFNFHLSAKNDSIEEHYILIIGEASRYDHFHLNGYARQTSPHLDTIAHLFSLQQCYAQANLTHSSVSMMLTRADVRHPQLAFQEKSIVEAFQQAGFQTAWISCQTLMDFVVRIAQNTDYYFEQVGGLSAQVDLDSVLVYEAAQMYHTRPARKSFFVLHAMGSHFKYDQRYPREFERFTPAIHGSDGYAVLSPDNKEYVINAYDNTILYTDYVLARAISLLQHQSGRCALIYMSDHGENLFDDDYEISVHGSYEGTDYEAHVPCFIWMNDAYRTAYPDKVDALKRNTHIPVSQDVLFHSLADMGELTEITDSTKSIFSTKLLPQDTLIMLTGNGSLYTILP